MKRKIYKVLLLIVLCSFLFLTLTYVYSVNLKSNNSFKLEQSPLKPWNFYCDQSNHWKWVNVNINNNELINQSLQKFNSKSDCIEDAIKNGYTK